MDDFMYYAEATFQHQNGTIQIGIFVGRGESACHFQYLNGPIQTLSDGRERPFGSVGTCRAAVLFARRATQGGPASSPFRGISATEG